MKLLEIFKRSNPDGRSMSPTSPSFGPAEYNSDASSTPSTPLDAPQHHLNNNLNNNSTTISIDSRNLNELDVYTNRVLEKYNGKQKKNLCLKVEKSLLLQVLNPSLISEKLLDKIFYVYASPIDSLVELRQFFAGLSTCCDGSTDDKLTYCFKLFDVDKDNNLSFADLTLMLETVYKISDIHSKLIKSSSTMLTLSRANTVQEAASTFNGAGTTPIIIHDLQGSGDLKQLNLSTAGLFLPSIQTKRSMTSIQDSHLSTSDHHTSLDGVVEPESPTSDLAIDATSLRSKRLSIKGLPMFENINRMLKSHSTDICREDLLVTSTESLNQPVRKELLSTESLTQGSRILSNESLSHGSRILSNDTLNQTSTTREACSTKSFKESVSHLSSSEDVTDSSKQQQQQQRKISNSSVGSGSELAEMIYASLNLEKTRQLSIDQYLQWIHKNPYAMAFLDKVKYIASIGKKHAHLAEEEREIIAKLSDSWKPNMGEECFIVSNKWWRLWLAYAVGNPNGSLTTDSTDSVEPPPGSIDNNDLLSSKEELADISDFYFLRDNLLESVDYVVVSKPMWNALLSWYGGGPQLVRQVKSIFGVSSHRKSFALASATNLNGFQKVDVDLDLYPLVLQLGLLKERKIFSRCVCSGEILLNDLRELACTQLNVAYQPALKLWVSYKNTDLVCLEGEDTTLTEFGLTSGYKVFVDGKLKHDRSLSVAIVSNWLSRVGTSSLNSPSTPMSPTTPSFGTGHVGLANLGNTCFLNAALQSLLHTTPLVNYFLLEHHGDYFKHYELDGAFTSEYMKLLKQYWNAKNFSHISPQSFRMALIRKFPQFGGMEQHDGQEALGLILDYLHMDLNLIKEKKNFENPDYNGQTDLDLSSIYWDNHLSRDSSIIVELFEGQFKSHCQCITCKHEIVKFHPFMFLSLPLPENHMRTLELVLVPHKGYPIRFRLKLDKSSLISDLMPKVKEVPNLTNSESFFVADVQLCYIFGFIRGSSPITDIRDRDQIYLYESFEDSSSTQVESEDKWKLDDNDGNEENADNGGKSNEDFRFVLLHRKTKGEWTIAGKRPKLMLFGVPLLKRFKFSERTEKLTGNTVYDSVRAALFDSYPELAGVCKEMTAALGKKQSAATPPVSATTSLTAQPQTLSPSSPSGPSKKIPQKYADAPFVLRRVNKNGMTCSQCTSDIYSSELTCTGCVIDINDDPVTLTDSETLALDWNTKAKKTVMEVEKILSTIKQDQSISQQSLQAENAIQLEDVLMEYEKVEWMSDSDFYCPKCKSHQPGVKRETIWKFPPCLMIQFKRFSYTNYGCIKNDVRVGFPLQNLNLTPYLTPNAENGRRNLMDLLPHLKRDNSHAPLPHDKKSGMDAAKVYDLYGVISHLGTFYDGHYVTHAKDQQQSESVNQKWHCFNDEEVKEWPVPADVITSNFAYVLLYKLRNMPSVEALQKRSRENAQRVSSRQMPEVKKSATIQQHEIN